MNLKQKQMWILMMMFRKDFRLKLEKVFRGGYLMMGLPELGLYNFMEEL